VSSASTELDHCAVNTKFNQKWKRQALRITVELFVMFYHKRLIYLAKNCFVKRISRSESQAKPHLNARRTKHQTRNSTSLPNEATRQTFNKRPLFPTKAQNNAKLPRQLPSWNATWQMRSKRLRARELETNRHDLQMKQPKNIYLFTGWEILELEPTMGICWGNSDELPKGQRTEIEKLLSHWNTSKHNAQLRCEPRYHDTQIGHRKHYTKPKPKMPSVGNHS